MGRSSTFPTITGDELRKRVEGLGLTITEAAAKLGLTRDGLYKQMGSRAGRQTELLLSYIERELATQRRRVSRDPDLPLEPKSAKKTADDHECE